jgi:WD40 repeat protein
MGHRGRVLGLSVSPDGRRLLTGGADGKVILWDARSGQIIHEMLGHTDVIECVTFLPDGKHALSGSLDKTIRLWHLSSGEEIYRFVGLTRQAIWLSVSRDGRKLLSADYTGHELRLWDLESRKPIQTSDWGSVCPTRGSFAPDGQHAAWSGSDGIVRLYRFADSDSASSPAATRGAIPGRPKPVTGRSSEPRKSR